MGVEPVPTYMEEDVSISDSQLVYRFRLALRSKSVPSVSSLNSCLHSYEVDWIRFQVNKFMFIGMVFMCFLRFAVIEFRNESGTLNSFDYLWLIR